MKIIVLDASIVLRFLLKEDDEIERTFSELLRGTKKKKIILVSNTFLQIEVANGLRFGIKDSTFAEKLLSVFLQLPITYVEFTQAQIQKALYISYKCKTTVYDASYHVLAISRNARLLTADREYFKKAHHIGNIDYLGELK
jgi:predicted nucleic acid-binding protein